MNSTDFIMEFPGGMHPNGLCRVRLFNSAVIITDLGDLNTGPSVTNAIEKIIAKLSSSSLINDSTIIFEHYEPELWFGHKFDLVTIDQNGLPIWESVEIDKVCDICGLNKSQLCSLIDDDKSLLKEIILKTKEALGSKQAMEEPKEIIGLKIPKQEIKYLIENHSSEREFQKILKKDLSLIAEVYADPKDEYICFSEFPINNRRADFVLFTGRSKMNIFIFEIKGADFFFSNKNGYKKLNEKISTCRHQIIENINQINTRGYDEFRQFCHDTRLKVESGESMYNSLIGLKKSLNVDPNKEIKIYGVIIGGRTRDDFYESNLRHHEENSTQNIKIESWNSWLNKLTRHT